VTDSLRKEIFEPMDVTLFQFSSAGAVSFPRLERLLSRRAARFSGASAGSPTAWRAGAEDSANLDVLRSFAVLLVAKFFNWRLAALRVTDFGLLGVMFFFVHTTLVLMFSLERQRAAACGPLFLTFMVRRCFRIYPLAILTIAFVYLFHIPSDLQFGGFYLLRQSAGNHLANILLIQNVTRQPANPGVLWSLPFELQMYLVLPALFVLAVRTKVWWAMAALWATVVAVWLVVGHSAGVLPLSESGIRSPWEALLKFTRFVPCFLPGLVAYQLWRRPRIFPAAAWLPFLGLCCAAFLYRSGGSPVQFGWLICLAIGLGAALFREMPANWFAGLAKRIARYSYGIYLLHYFAIWLAFVVCRERAAWMRIALFVVVLAAFPALLYHTVEAPMIRTGVRLSRKFQSQRTATGIGDAPGVDGARIGTPCV
jgi:peptidoglycan/LPS O-acetylase OafA/YrhL